MVRPAFVITALVAGQATLTAAAETAQQYTTNAMSLANGMNLASGWYDPSIGLWQDTWWQSANIITTLAELGSLEPVLASTSEWYLANTFKNAPGKAAGSTPNTFLDGFYDDEGWWALAWVAAFDLTGNQQYLQAAESLFEDMTAGYNTPCGGIWWDKAHTQIASIANELFLSVAAHLANRVPAKKDYYVNWAVKEWGWFSNIGVINAAGTINDGIDPVTCKNNNGEVFTYNQGAVLGGLVELTKATGDASYTTTATNIASAAIRDLADNNILVEHGGSTEDPTRAQFKGVFVRNLKYLQKATGNAAFKSFLQINADSIWANDRDASSELAGPDWQGPLLSVTAPSQASALDCLVAAAAVS